METVTRTEADMAAIAIRTAVMEIVTKIEAATAGTVIRIEVAVAMAATVSKPDDHTEPRIRAQKKIRPIQPTAKALKAAELKGQRWCLRQELCQWKSRAPMWFSHQYSAEPSRSTRLLVNAR